VYHIMKVSIFFMRPQAPLSARDCFDPTHILRPSFLEFDRSMASRNLSSSCMDDLNSNAAKMKRLKATNRNASNHVVLLFFTILSFHVCSHTGAQIISHELRRLATSTNQFGIDSLRALDKMEPPDKVLVFCPVCLSSSLVMIMMGSSKYQVVSSLRHALYVWTLKPYEINRGFRDIFDHIGLNQQQFFESRQSSTETDDRAGATRFQSMQGKESGLHNSNKLARNKRKIQSKVIHGSHTRNYLSLPNLIRLREFLDRPTGNDIMTKPVSSMQKNFHNSSRKLIEASTPIFNKMDTWGDQLIASKSREISHDTFVSSHMSAMSNVYIQRGLNLNFHYNLLLRQYYKTVVHPVDFIRNGEETRQHINSIVAASTEGKIKDLVRRGTFDRARQPKVMIISTFHFRGTLDIQMKQPEFDVNRLENRSISSRSWQAHLMSNKTGHLNHTAHQIPTKNRMFIETEESLIKHGVFAELDCSVFEIPFNNRLVSLIIVMPNNRNSSETLLTKLNAKTLSDMITSLSVKRLSIEIPIIKFDRGPVNFEGLLRELGLDDCFFGDKPYTSETGFNKWLRPSDLVHETSIDIGTINPKWIQSEDRLKVGAHESRKTDLNRDKISEANHIKLDKSFFYFVLDSINGLVLTMGRIRQ